MRISDCSSDVCSSALVSRRLAILTLPRGDIARPVAPAAIEPVEFLAPVCRAGEQRACPRRRQEVPPKAVEPARLRVEVIDVDMLPAPIAGGEITAHRASPAPARGAWGRGRE